MDTRAVQIGGASISSENEHEKLESIMSALQCGKFFICVQPMFLMPERRIIGAEALLRWNEPKVGIIFPHEFIPSAERAGLTELLDLYALEQACLCIKDWRDNSKPSVPINLNLSASALLSHGFVDAVSGCMARHGLPHECIRFELSLRFMRDYPDDFSRVVTYFHDHGFGCAVDGFALAPDLLPLVRAHKVDMLKINCSSFVTADEEQGIHNCIKTFHDARDMGVKVLLESIETPRQVHALIFAGCKYMQGYSLSMPVSTGLFTRMLEKQG